MTTITNLLSPSSTSRHLRPFDVRRDLRNVADLVEQCFSETLDPDGERYLRHMRSAAANPGFLHWAAATAEWTSMPFAGFVWEEDGRLVGNISLIPYAIQGRRQFLIANVAVHPGYRRQGIARALTWQAIEHARQRGAPSVWLHVRENNEAAVHLYTSLGFCERARRTTWHSQEVDLSPSLPANVTLGPRSSLHWSSQHAWLQAVYPQELTWHLQIDLKALRPGLSGGLYRLLTNSYIKQWSATRNGRLIGVIAWQASRSFADNLWLSASPEEEERAVYALLLHARRHLPSRRPLALDYPAFFARDAIQAAGFTVHQTLIWMEKQF